MQEILDVATSFFVLNGVEINTKKTQVIVINRDKGAEGTLMFGTPAEEIKPVGKDEPVRILGVWVTASGTVTTTERIVEREVRTICSILSPKAVTDKQTSYIINNVLIPRILYRISAQILPRSFMRRMTGKYMKLAKSKARMPSTTPNSIMHHQHFFAIKKLEDAQAEEQVSTLAQRLNDRGLLGRICRARIMALQRHCEMDVCPLTKPSRVKQFKHNFASGVCTVMANRNMSLHIHLARDFGLERGTQSIKEVFGDEIDEETRVGLVKRMIYYAEQLLTRDGSLKSWKEVRSGRKDPKHSPAWFNSLQDLMNQTNYTADFQEEWFRRSKEELQQLDEASDEMEESEDYVSDVEGQTEDEWEAVAEVEEQYVVLERDLVE
ncbi:hypothetical protein EDD11_007440, partial [Mortierella claussenii]